MEFTYDEVYNSTLEFFKGDELATNVFFKYALSDGEVYYEKTPKDMWTRLAKEIHRIECKYSNPMSYEEIYDCFEDWKTLPGGSILSGAGNPYSITSLSNCFATPNPPDQMSGIFNTARNLANLSKRRGGVGICLSSLRPEGASVNNAAKTSSGAWSWGNFLSQAANAIGQKNRRAALLLGMHVWHPDIVKFIKMKQDLSTTTSANISVFLTNAFMEAVKADADWDLVFNGRIYETVKATYIWDLIAECACKTGEPGILNWDIYADNVPLHHYPGYEMVAPNPCLPANAKFLTPDGIRTTNDINIGDVIWGKVGWTNVVNKKSSGIQDVYKYNTNSGYFLGTKEHGIISNEVKTPVDVAKSIDILKGMYRGFISNRYFDSQTVMDGVVFGDGMIHKASDNLILLCIGKDDISYFESEIKDLIIKDRTKSFKYGWEINTTLNYEDVCNISDRKIPKRFIQGDKKTVISFLRGLYTANGSVVTSKRDCRVTLKTINKDVLEDVQVMLSSVGINSYYTSNKAKVVKFSNGEYLCKVSYDLNIRSDSRLFLEFIGFIQPYKNDNLKEALQRMPDGWGKKPKKSFDITSKEFVAAEEVWDITVDNESHTFWNNGLHVANCGELLLSGGSSCILTSNTLTKFVENPYTDKADFNHCKYNKYVERSVRILDDIVDLELEALDRIISVADTDDEIALFKNIKHMCESTRRIGLGTLGLADTFIMLGIKYDSEEALDLTKRIYNDRALGAYLASYNLAKERGAFPAYNSEYDNKCPFIQQLPKSLKEEMSKTGRRNGALLTDPPTGSIAQLAQVSSGIEPIFDLTYTRRRKLNNDSTATPDSEDSDGNKYEHYKVIHKSASDYMELYNIPTLEELPKDLFVTANNLDWRYRVKLQGIISRASDGGVSSTINLPKETKSDVVKDIYALAYEEKIKGITVYVDECRDGVLIREDNKVCSDWYIRPEELPCEIHRVSCVHHGETHNHIIVVSLREDQPYEIFGGQSENSCIPSGVDKGIIKKHKNKKKNRYELIYEDGKISNIGDEFNCSEFATINRLISLSLRNKAGINFVVDQLLRDPTGDMFAYAKVVARVLKKYISDNSSSGNLCPNCGEKTLRYESGCSVCTSCSYSGCS